MKKSIKNRHKKTICTICDVKMRSDNLKRHNESKKHKLKLKHGEDIIIKNEHTYFHCSCCNKDIRYDRCTLHPCFNEKRSYIYENKHKNDPNFKKELDKSANLVNNLNI